MIYAGDVFCFVSVLGNLAAVSRDWITTVSYIQETVKTVIPFDSWSSSFSSQCPDISREFQTFLQTFPDTINQLLSFPATFRHFQQILAISCCFQPSPANSTIPAILSHFLPFPAISSQLQPFTAIYNHIQPFHSFPAISK